MPGSIQVSGTYLPIFTSNFMISSSTILFMVLQFHSSGLQGASIFVKFGKGYAICSSPLFMRTSKPFELVIDPIYHVVALGKVEHEAGEKETFSL